MRPASSRGEQRCGGACHGGRPQARAAAAPACSAAAGRRWGVTCPSRLTSPPETLFGEFAESRPRLSPAPSPEGRAGPPCICCQDLTCPPMPASDCRGLGRSGSSLVGSVWNRLGPAGRSGGCLLLPTHAWKSLHSVPLMSSPVLQLPGQEHRQTGCSHMPCLWATHASRESAPKAGWAGLTKQVRRLAGPNCGPPMTGAVASGLRAAGCPSGHSCQLYTQTPALCVPQGSSEGGVEKVCFRPSFLQGAPPHLP